MAITRLQLEDLGFKKIRRKHFNTYHNALLYPINETDYIFSGYDKVTKKTNFKILWMSKVLFGNERVTYPLEHIGELSFTKVKNFLQELKRLEEVKQHARDNQQD